MLKITNVKKSYKTKSNTLEVLKGIDIEIKEKEIVAIVGPSGAGKSTLLHIIGALDKPDSGSVVLDGQSIYKLNDRTRAKLRNEKVGFVFQFYHLLPEFSALENVILPKLIQEDQKKNMVFNQFPEFSVFQNLFIPFSVNYNRRLKRIKEKGKELLDKFGLGARIDHKPFELSGGEQQRVSIVRALINDPKVILCDEPTGNLDSENGRQIIDTILKLNKENKQTFVIVTHDQNIAKLSHRTIFIKDGLVVK